MKITIYEVASLISAWLLGVFTQTIGNDSKAIELCRMDLLDLGEALRSLSCWLRVPHRNGSSDAEKIDAIRKKLRRLNVNQAGLFIKNSDLQKLIAESLALIRRSEVDHGKPQNKPHNIAIDLGTVWGEGCGRSYEATKIESLNNEFFNTNVFWRFWWRVRRKTKFCTFILFISFLIF